MIRNKFDEAIEESSQDLEGYESGDSMDDEQYDRYQCAFRFLCAYRRAKNPQLYKEHEADNQDDIVNDHVSNLMHILDLVTR